MPNIQHILCKYSNHIVSTIVVSIIYNISLRTYFLAFNKYDLGELCTDA